MFQSPGSKVCRNWRRFFDWAREGVWHKPCLQCWPFQWTPSAKQVRLTALFYWRIVWIQTVCGFGWVKIKSVHLFPLVSSNIHSVLWNTWATWVEQFLKGWEVIGKLFGWCRDGSSCLTRLMTRKLFFVFCNEFMWIQGVLGSSSSGSTVDLSPERTTTCFGSRLNRQARPSTSSEFHFLLREQYTRTSSYSGQPFIFNMIHTFGGQVVKMN